MSSAGVAVVATPLILDARRASAGHALIITAASTIGLRALLRCDGCGQVCAAGVDEAAARLNLEATGGAVVDGLDLCPGCVR